MLVTVTVIAAVVSFVCFGLWARLYGSSHYSIANTLAYYSAPIYVGLSPVVYILAFVQLGFHYNWFAIIAYAIIIANAVFYIWAFRKFKAAPLDFLFEIDRQTGFSIITVPHAMLVLTLGFLVLPA